MEWRRVLAKAFELPAAAIPGYGVAYLRNYLGRARSAEGRVRSWGPVFPGMSEYARTHDLVQTCALQWRACVDAATHDLELTPSDDRMVVRYEDFVRDPRDALDTVVARAGLRADARALEAARAMIEPGSVGKWRRGLSAVELAAVEGVCGTTLTELGYT
jgi:hypothetical protein